MSCIFLNTLDIPWCSRHWPQFYIRTTAGTAGYWLGTLNYKHVIFLKKKKHKKAFVVVVVFYLPFVRIWVIKTYRGQYLVLRLSELFFYVITNNNKGDVLFHKQLFTKPQLFFKLCNCSHYYTPSDTSGVTSHVCNNVLLVYVNLLYSSTNTSVKLPWNGVKCGAVSY